MPADTQHEIAAGLRMSPVDMVRSVVAGVLMGLANLIPGVSGGTMILAVGLYEEFIDAVADVTAFRFGWRRILFLMLLIGAAGVAIVALSSVILFLLFRYSAPMFALFIGLTLGGAPLLVRMIGRSSTGSVAATLCGLVLMAAIAFTGGGAAMPRNMAMDVVSGVVGATTMVLPGISGSYMLLILGQYDRVVGAIADLKEGAFESLWIIGPVGIGAVVGVVGLSNLLKFLLHRWERATLGFLLGMLLGSVLGLWPFGRPPTEKILDSRTVTELVQFAETHEIPITRGMTHEQLVEHIYADWDKRGVDDYAPATVVSAVIMLIIGLATTLSLGRLGVSSKTQATESAVGL